MKMWLTALTTMLAMPVSAHLGHGDHSALIAAGEAHPMLGNEHLMLATAALAGVYLALRILRK